MDNVEKLFWNNVEACCLYDVLCGGQANEKLRQQLLEREKQRRRKQHQQQDGQQQQNDQQQDQQQCEQQQCEQKKCQSEQKEQEHRLLHVVDCHLQVPAEDAGASRELLLPPTPLLQPSSALPPQPLTLPPACASAGDGGLAPVVAVCVCEVKVSTV